MEMLIVVAIIAILIAIAVPAISSALSKAKEATCAANRRSLQTELITRQIDDGEKTLEDVWKDASAEVNAAWKEKYICPAGGTISVSKNAILCTKHGDIRTTEQILLDDFLAVQDSWEYGKPGYEKWPGNDSYRDWLYQNKYPEGWPPVTLSGNTYYMQPYFYDKEGTSVIFANKNSDVQRNWNANAIYDKENGVWWTGTKTLGVANKTWDALKDEMIKQGWTQVK